MTHGFSVCESEKLASVSNLTDFVHKMEELSNFDVDSISIFDVPFLTAKGVMVNCRPKAEIGSS